MNTKKWVSNACVVAFVLVAANAIRADVPGGFHLTGALYTVDGGLVQTPASNYGTTQYNADLDKDGNVVEYSASLWEAAAFSWDVQWDGGDTSLVSYTYTFDGNALGTLSGDVKDLSHFIIDVSDGLTMAENGDLRNFEYYTGTSWVSYPTDSNGNPYLEIQDNPGIDGDATLKFDETSELTAADGVWQFRFESTRAPMWGALQLVDGVDENDQNNPKTRLTASTDDYANFDFSNLEGEVDLLDFIAYYQGTSTDFSTVSYYTGDSESGYVPVYGILVPDTATITEIPFILVPEPGSAILGMLFLLTGLTVRRHRRHAA